MGRPSSWTEADDRLLMEAWPKAVPMKQLEEALGRRASSITERRRKLGLPPRIGFGSRQAQLHKVILDVLHKHGPMDRMQVAFATKRTLGAVGSAIQRMRAEGLVHVGAWGRSHGQWTAKLVAGPGEDAPRQYVTAEQKAERARKWAQRRRKRIDAEVAGAAKAELERLREKCMLLARAGHGDAIRQMVMQMGVENASQ